jgi:hypothetical protein
MSVIGLKNIKVNSLGWGWGSFIYEEGLRVGFLYLLAARNLKRLSLLYL